MIFGRKTKSIWIPVFTGIIIGVAVFALGAKTVSASTISKPPNNLGLVAYYSFEDATGTKATDFSGGGNTGTLTNMETTDWGSGKRGRALDFGGTDEYVTIPDSAALRPGTGDWSMSAWIRPADADAAMTIVGKQQNGGAYNGIGMKVGTQNADGSTTNSKKLSFVVATAAGSDWVVYRTTNDVADGNWHHVVMTRVGSSDTIAAYVDGVSVSLTSIASNGTIPHNVNNTDPWTVAVANTLGGYFVGPIDEVRIYNRTLGATEVAALYGGGQPGLVRIKEKTNKGLVGYWSFEDATGTIATDFSGYNSKGILTGMSNTNWVKGKIGTGLNFTTSTEYVDAGNSNILKTNPATIAFWVNTTDSGSGARAIQKQGTWAIIPSQGGDGANGVSISDSGCVCGRNSLVRVDDGLWHHIAFSYQSGTTNGSFIYVDGTLATTTENTLTDTTQPVKFGGSNFVGKIDDVRIYNRILTAAEVATIYQAGGYGGVKSNSSKNNQLTDGLVGLWSFDGPDLYGTRAYDRSGTGNNGTLTNGPIPAIGKIGQALRFDGTNDYVNVADHNSLDLTDLTISFWFKPNVTLNAATGRKDFLVKYLSYWIIFNYPGNDGKLILTTNSGGNSIRTTVTSWEADTWYYFVATVNASSDAKIYINGVEDISGTVSVPNAGAAALEIGGSAGAGSYPNITMDEVRLYNRVLTAAEVLQLYNMGK